MINFKELTKLAKQKSATLVFPEASFSNRIVAVGKYLVKHKICKVIFIGDESAFVLKYRNLQGITIINPKTSELLEEFSTHIYEKRSHKGITQEQALLLAENSIYFSTLLLKYGIADGLVCGAETTTADTLRPALELLRDNDEFISSAALLYGKNPIFGKKAGALILSDPGLNINLTADGVAKSAIYSASVMKSVFGIQPKVALMSYSTKGSAGGEGADKMREAIEILKQNNVDFEYDGEYQFDAAFDASVRELKAPNSSLKGSPNILIFPDLASANIASKIMQRMGGLNYVGPFTLGFKYPVNDLSRGATIKDILEQCIITLLQINNENKGENI